MQAITMRFLRVVVCSEVDGFVQICEKKWREIFFLIFFAAFLSKNVIEPCCQ